MENNNAEAIEFIKKVVSFFERNKLKESSLDDLTKELEEQSADVFLLKSFKENKFNTKQYPKLNITIGCDKEGNIIQSEIENLESISDKNFKELTEHVEKSNDVYLKLLYSIVWKQGDLTKLDGIIKGITNKSDESKTGTTFKAFGKHLRDKSNPIIDQHVMRAYLAITETKNQNLFLIRQLKDNFIDKKQKEIENYKTWLNNLHQSGIHKGNIDFFYYADQILFNLGKTIKLKK